MSDYNKRLHEKAKRLNWSHRKIISIIKRDKYKPISIALKNLEKES